MKTLSLKELKALSCDWQLSARQEQLPPIGNWFTWLILGGRGAGKTRAGAEWVHDASSSGYLMSQSVGPKLTYGRIALVAETLSDAREVMVDGQSGILNIATRNRPVYESSRRRLIWPNGAIAQIFSSEDPESAVNVPPGIYSIVHIQDGIQSRIGASRLVTSSSLDQLCDLSKLEHLDVSSGFVPNVVFLDLPLLSGTNPMDWARAAAYAKPWVPVYLASSSGDDGYQQRTNLPVPAFIGTLLQDLDEGVEGRFDYLNNIYVNLPFGEFETIELSQLLAGGNFLAIRCQNEAWEIVQFQSALEIAPNQWQLSNLLRAQSGTEDAMTSGALAGADAVLINENVMSLGLSSAELDAELNWQISGVGKSNSQLDIVSFKGGTRAHTPISPVHLRGQRIAGGIALNWIRRGRISADNWSGVEIPEDEDQLQFLVKIFNETVLVHEVITDNNSYLYEDAQQLLDFGFHPSELVFSVQQIGGQIAQGIARTASISV